MSTQPQLRRLMRELSLTAIAAALLWATTAAAIVVGVASLVPGLPATWLAPGGAIAVFVIALIRRGPIRSASAVALWVEQQQASLRYAFIAAVELEANGGVPAPELLQAAGQVDLSRLVRQSRRRAVQPAAVVTTVALLALFLLLRFVPAARAGGGPNAALTTAPDRNRLAVLTAHLSPPAYSGIAPSHVKEPDRLAALQGTRVRVQGEGAAAGLGVAGLSDSLVPRDSAGGWALAFAMPAEPAVLTLRDREHRRLLTLLPYPDSIPEVVLRRPMHDTTYRAVPTAPIALEADASDDLGLAHGYWEFLITTGSGDDQFETITRIAGRVAFGKSQEGTLHYSLRLDTLHLRPGSVINVRAVVLDANNLTGPGRGVSETRTMRIAPVIDSTSVAAEPAIPIDSMWMSQRLLNLRTDTLLLERRRLKRGEFGSRSVSLSNGQEVIRSRVIAVVALLEDDGVGGSEPTEDSKLLRQAADAMLNARFLLATAEPDSARPFMRRALAILDQIRLAKRYYIRGVLRPNPVDIASVRLTGTERGAPAPPAARPPLSLADRGIAERLARVVQLAETDPAAARDTLIFLQVQLLRPREDVAALIGTALAAAKQGTPIAMALVPARRRLTPAPVRLDGSAEWSGGSAP